MTLHDIGAAPEASPVPAPLAPPPRQPGPPPHAASVAAAQAAVLPPLTRRRTYVSNLTSVQAPPQAHEPEAAIAAAAPRYRADVAEAARHLGLSAHRADSMSSAAEARAVQMTHAMVSDTSQWRIQRADTGELHSICRLLAAELEAAAPPNTLRNEASNWRHWEAWCAYMGTTPLRNDIRGNSGADQVGYEREVLLLAAGLPFILQRMRRRPGWNTPPTPLSALQVLRGIRRVHKRLGTPMAPLSLACVLVNKLLDDYVRVNGADALMPKRKEPLTNVIIRAMLFLPNGTPMGGAQPRGAPPTSARVDWRALEWISVRAMFATLAQTGMRKAEVALPAGDAFGAKHLSRANLAWRIRGRLLVGPTADELGDLTEGDYALLTVAPSKADQHGLIWSPAPIVLPYHASEGDFPICAARELMRLELAVPLSNEARRAAPLFPRGTRDSSGRWHPWRHAEIDARFQAMLRATGVAPERAGTYSMHSWRIYLACALLASGAPHSQILSMLRWRSDEALRLYARLNDTTYATWLDASGTAEIESIRASNIATVAESQRAQEQRDWLRRSAIASDSDPRFDATALPRHSHDDEVADMQAAGNGLAAAAAAADAAADE